MYLAISILTTGPDIKRDKVLDIALVPFSHEGVLPTCFNTQINPELHLSAELLQLTPLYQQKAETAPKFYEIAKELLSVTNNQILVAVDSRFVYSFLKKEFKNLGFSWKASFISIDALTQDLSIKPIRPHLLIKPIQEAHTIAETGVQYLLATPNKKQSAAWEGILPPRITAKCIASLPTTAGIYYFKDVNGLVIYVGKSTNIRKRVRSHFQVDLQSSKAVSFKSSIAAIHFQETGSELLALLIESEEIKRLNPRYNVALRPRNFAYAIESFTDNQGYLNLKVAKLNTQSKQHLPVTSLRGGKELLHWLVESYGLCQKLCSLYKTKGSCFDFVIKKCAGACINEEQPQVYNLRVQEALSRFTFPWADFIVTAPGRHSKEKALVWVQANTYKGYGYVDVDAEVSLANVKNYIDPKPDDKDAKTILRSYLSQAKETSIIRT